MQLLKKIKSKKLLLLNIFLTIYVFTNLIGGERGLISYYEKKNQEQMLIKTEDTIRNDLLELEKKNKLLSEKIDFDYLDTLYREKLKVGKKNEVLIRLK
jgi:cell division protein DivIC|tara:strand:+ start:144 stop:440 length:297 start_codon:yes stop_codon:yes gene_type:complete